MIIKLLDKLLGIQQQPEETVDSLKNEIRTAKQEAVDSINKMNRMIEKRNVTFDIHIATGGQGSNS